MEGNFFLIKIWLRFQFIENQVTGILNGLVYKYILFVHSVIDN